VEARGIDEARKMMAGLILRTLDERVQPPIESREDPRTRNILRTDLEALCELLLAADARATPMRPLQWAPIHAYGCTWVQKQKGCTCGHKRFMDALNACRKLGLVS
jgi:hypothetical protein